MKIDTKKPLMIARQRVGDYFPGLNPKTLANLNSQGLGPTPYKPQDRVVFYKTEDLEEYVMGANK